MKSEIRNNEKEINIQAIKDDLVQNFKKLLKYGNRIDFDSKNVNIGELEYFKDDQDFKQVLKIILSHDINKHITVLKKYNIDNINLENYYLKISPQLSKAMACFICSGIGDALGSHIEFYPIKYDRKPIITGFHNDEVSINIKRCNLGEFSDDTSMALCLADDILFNNFQFYPADLQIKFINWWNFSYNNCLKPRRHSFGLGGNINKSMQNFINQSINIINSFNSSGYNIDKISNEEFLNLLNCNINLENSENTSGNGSLMRLAPVPIAFAKLNSIEEAEIFAANQSKVTHSGEEASEACRLLTNLIINLINFNLENSDIKIAIDNSLLNFKTNNYSVDCIKKSEKESKIEFERGIRNGFYYKELNKNLEDRNWNWKDINYKYSPTREKSNPEYIGSYALDSLTMALHISYYSSSPKEAIIKAANMGGDCDTVAAIMGQIVGAYYGLDKELLELYEGVSKFDEYKIAYMAYKLFEKRVK